MANRYTIKTAQILLRIKPEMKTRISDMAHARKISMNKFLEALVENEWQKKSFKST